MKLVQKFMPQYSKTHVCKSSPKEKTVTLGRLHSTLKTDNEVVNINPLILFSRLILLAEREEETAPCFKYGLQITRFHSSRIV